MEQKYIDRFWTHVQKTETCWIWMASFGSHGYGNSWDGKNVKTAHRVSWEIHFGEIPKGLHVCHHCDNHKCVNPSHLFLGTHKDNMQDMSRKGRATTKPRRGEENNKAKLTWVIVRKIREIWNNEHPVHRKARKFTSRRLGELFGVKHKTILQMLHNETWKEENEPH